MAWRFFILSLTLMGSLATTFFVSPQSSQAADPVIPRLQNNLPVNSSTYAPPTSNDTDSVIEEFEVSSMVSSAYYQFTHNITCGGGGGCIFGGRTRIYFSTNGTDWVQHENFDVTVGMSPRTVNYSPAIGPYKYVKWETYSSSQVTSAPAAIEMTQIDVGFLYGTAAGGGGGGTPTPPPSSSPTPTPTPSGGGGGGSAPTPTPGTGGSTPTPTPTPVLTTAASCASGISNVAVSALATAATVTFNSASSTKGTLYVYPDSRTTPPKDESKKAAGYATNSRKFAETTATKTHSFAVDALSPETTYYYTLLSGSTQECEHSFTTQAVPVVAEASPIPTPTSTDDTGSGGGNGDGIGDDDGDSNGDGVSTSVLGDSFPWEAFIAALFLIGTLGGVLVPGLGVNPSSWWFNVASKRKRINPWGRVWSTLTQAGIPGVIVSLIDPSHYNRVIERAKSQEDGSFGFTAPAGKYVLWAEKSGFVFPSQHAPSGYTGGEVAIDEGGIIQTDIPMDQTQKNRTFRDKGIHLLLQLEVFRLPLLIFGTMVTIAFLIYELWWVTILFLIYYLILWYWEFQRIHDSQHLLIVRDGHNKPVAFASVRLKTGDGTIVLTRSTNAQGQVFILVPQGTYDLEITPPVQSALHKYEQSLTLERGILVRRMVVRLLSTNAAF